MTAEEFSNRFDVLYNNIMSDQAPGLDNYEKSVFLNKAQLEVLKNHLNPKGNKYGEGYDGSSKRQIDFSGLTVEESFLLFPNNVDRINSSTWRASIVNTTSDGQEGSTPSYSVADCPVDYTKMLSITNETLGVADNELDYYVKLAKTMMIGDALGFDINKDGKVNTSDITALTDDVLADIVPESADPAVLIAYLLGNKGTDSFILKTPKTPEEIIQENNIRTWRLVVVPINNVEYDTLMSRPFKYPPKAQAWRIIVNGTPEFIIGPGMAPYKYNIRYVKMPSEFNLDDNTISDIPEMLHDEVLQRAVELAKNSWEGNSQTTVELGGRSE